MISSHALSTFLLQHRLNGLRNANLRSVQEAMRASKPVTEKYKNVCEDLPNLGILTKISTPGEVQLTFVHSTRGNKSLGGSIQAFALAGNLGSPSVILFNLDIAFATEGPGLEDLHISAPTSPQRTQKRKSPVRARGDAGKQAGHGEIQERL